MTSYRDPWAFMTAPPKKLPRVSPDNAGRCLAGTVELPLVWWRFPRHGPEQRQDGRVCDWRHRATSKVQCGSCPAYRGLDQWEQPHRATWDGSTPDDPQYRNMTDVEHRAYLRAQAAADEDDDWRPMARFIYKLHFGTALVDDEVDAYRRERVAAWRDAHPDEAREQNRKAARRYRARKRRAASVMLSPSREAGSLR
jgi:hypothetical protein